MNPAALKTNLNDLETGGILILDQRRLRDRRPAQGRLRRQPPRRRLAARLQGLRGADHQAQPRGGGPPQAQPPRGGPLQEPLRPRPRSTGSTSAPSSRPSAGSATSSARSRGVLEANLRALRAGYDYGETTEAIAVHYRVAKANIQPGTYRKITGNEATALGLLTASERLGLPLVFAGYPITPASDILHQLAEWKHFGVKTLQAEDEIAAVGAAIGASFGGALGVTATSGPGICLKSEAIGLAVMTELPLVIIDVQRGGPSTGLPTKTEQSDLLQVMFGRNGECPVPVVAASSPGDCFDAIVEAARLAVQHMTPVFFLSDGYLANGAEPWQVPDLDAMPDVNGHVRHGAQRRGRRPAGLHALQARRRGSSAPGRCRARRAWNTASAASKSRT